MHRLHGIPERYDQGSPDRSSSASKYRDHLCRILMFFLVFATTGFDRGYSGSVLTASRNLPVTQVPNTGRQFKVVDQSEFVADPLVLGWLGELLDDGAGDSSVPCFYSGAFQQKRQLKGLPGSLTTLGRFVHDCQRGVIWEMQNPRQETLIYTQKNRHFRLDADHTVTLLESRSAQRMAALLLNLLGGNQEALGAEFVISKKSSPAQHMTLTPRSKTVQQFISSIEVLGSTRTLQITVNTVSNGVTTIDVANLQAHDNPCADVATLAGPACEHLIKITANSIR